MNSIAEHMYAPRDAREITGQRFGVGVVVRREDGAILLERRADSGMWGLPGGRVEPGESVAASAVREVLEETGLRVELTRLIGIYSDPAERVVTYPGNGDVTHKIDPIVEARILGGELRTSSESEELAFFNPTQLPCDIAPPARRPLEDYCRGRSGVIA